MAFPGFFDTIYRIKDKSVYAPGTAGGDIALPDRLGVKKPQWEQKDKSLNGKIWGLFPVEKGWEELDEMSSKGFKEVESLLGKGVGPYPQKKLLKAIPAHERAREAAKLSTLYWVFFELVTRGVYRPKEAGKVMPRYLLQGRKAKGEIEPIAGKVKRIEAIKEKANKLSKKKPLDALLQYATALVEMYPWTATALLWNAQDAFGLGVAQLEEALWSNAAAMCIRIGNGSPVRRWGVLGAYCADAVLQARYTSHKLLSKCYYRYMDAYVMFQVPQGWKRPRPEDLPSPCDALVMMSILTGLAGDITETFVLSSRMAAAHIDKPEVHKHAQAVLNAVPTGEAEHWAHWGCQQGHSTCFAAGSVYVAEMEGKELVLPNSSQSFVKDVDRKLFQAMKGRIAGGEFAEVKVKGKEKATEQK